MKDVLAFTRWTLMMGGLWPLKRVPAYFVTVVVYLSVQVVLAVWEGFYIVGNLPLLIMNVSEWLAILTMILSIILVFFNKNLKLLIDRINEEMGEQKFCLNLDERRLYHRYHDISYKVGKYVTIVQILITILIFFRPLIEILGHALSGNRYFPVFESENTKENRQN